MTVTRLSNGNGHVCACSIERWHAHRGETKLGMLAALASSCPACSLQLPTLNLTCYLSGSNGFDGEGCELRVWDRRTMRQLFDMRGHLQVLATARHVWYSICVASFGWVSSRHERRS